MGYFGWVQDVELQYVVEFVGGCVVVEVVGVFFDFVDDD